MKQLKKIATNKLFNVLYFFIINFSLLNAQSFTKGSIAINGGIGIGSSITYYGGAGVSRTPVISISGEYGIDKLGPGTVGLGLALGYQSASYSSNYGSYYYKDKWTTTMFGIRGTYHPDFLNGEKYDVYCAVQLSFNHFGYSFTSNDTYYLNNNVYGHSRISSYARAYLMVGGRYYFTKNIGAFAELGYDIAYLKLGVSLKLSGEKTSTKK